MTLLNGRNSTATATETSESRFLRLKQQLIAGMDLSTLGTIEEDELHREVRRAAEDLTQRGNDLLNHSDRERLVNEVIDEIFGLGPLEPLLRDPTISDIVAGLVNA